MDRLAKAADLVTRTILDRMDGWESGEPPSLLPNLMPYAHLVQETRNYYSLELHGALMEFYRSIQGAYSRLVALQQFQFDQVPAVHGEAEQAREKLSRAMHQELHGNVKTVEVSLSYEDGEDGRGTLSANLKNVGNKILDSWLIELRAPRALVEGASGPNYGSFLPNESNPKISVFRTTLGLAREQPIFRDATRSLKVPFRMTDQLIGILDLPIEARVYIDGAIEGTAQRPVRELTSFFSLAMITIRKLQQDLHQGIAQRGSEVLNEVTEQNQDKLHPDVGELKTFLESERERIADFGFNSVVEPSGTRTIAGRMGVTLTATSRDGTEQHSISIEVGMDAMKSVTVLIDGAVDPKVSARPFARPPALQQFLRQQRLLDYFRDVILGKGLPSAVGQVPANGLTYSDFKHLFEQALRNQYRTRLSKKIIFEDQVQTPKRWQAVFTVDGKDHIFVFYYGVPPLAEEEVRLRTKIAGFCQGLP